MNRVREALSLERLTRIVVVVAALLLVVSVILNVTVLRTAGSGTSAVKEVREGTRISACRVLWADDVEFARSEYLIATGDVGTLILRGLEQVATGDTEQLARIVDRGPHHRQVVRERRDEFRAALHARRAANELALTDQGEFLALCAARQP